MPNWCFNYLGVDSNEQDTIAIKAQLNTPFEVEHDSFNTETREMERKVFKYSNPVFAFWNIVKPTDLEAYHRQPEHSLPLSEQLKFQTDDWYAWNIRNWGTKWDVAVRDEETYPETEELDNYGFGGLSYRFNTAWSPPIEAITTLSTQYPNAKFVLSYEEETGWGGEVVLQNGQTLSSNEYGWKCRECDWQEDEQPYCETCEFDMCPSCGYGEPMDEDRAKCEDHREEENLLV